MEKKNLIIEQAKAAYSNFQTLLRPFPTGAVIPKVDIKLGVKQNLILFPKFCSLLVL